MNVAEQDRPGQPVTCAPMEDF